MSEVRLLECHSCGRKRSSLDDGGGICHVRSQGYSVYLGHFWIYVDEVDPLDPSRRACGLRTVLQSSTADSKGIK